MKNFREKCILALIGLSIGGLSLTSSAVKVKGPATQARNTQLARLKKDADKDASEKDEDEDEDEKKGTKNKNANKKKGKSKDEDEEEEEELGEKKNKNEEDEDEDEEELDTNKKDVKKNDGKKNNAVLVKTPEKLLPAANDMAANGMAANSSEVYDPMAAEMGSPTAGEGLEENLRFLFATYKGLSMKNPMGHIVPFTDVAALTKALNLEKLPLAENEKITLQNIISDKREISMSQRQTALLNALYPMLTARESKLMELQGKKDMSGAEKAKWRENGYRSIDFENLSKAQITEALKESALVTDEIISKMSMDDVYNIYRIYTNAALSAQAKVEEVKKILGFKYIVPAQIDIKFNTNEAWANFFSKIERYYGNLTAAANRARQISAQFNGGLRPMNNTVENALQKHQAHVMAVLAKQLVGLGLNEYVYEALFANASFEVLSTLTDELNGLKQISDVSIDAQTINEILNPTNDDTTLPLRRYGSKKLVDDVIRSRAKAIVDRRSNAFSSFIGKVKDLCASAQREDSANYGIYRASEYDVMNNITTDLIEKSNRLNKIYTEVFGEIDDKIGGFIIGKVMKDIGIMDYLKKLDGSSEAAGYGLDSVDNYGKFMSAFMTKWNAAMSVITTYLKDSSYSDQLSREKLYTYEKARILSLHAIISRIYSTLELLLTPISELTEEKINSLNLKATTKQYLNSLLSSTDTTVKFKTVASLVGHNMILDARLESLIVFIHDAGAVYANKAGSSTALTVGGRALWSANAELGKILINNGAPISLTEDNTDGSLPKNASIAFIPFMQKCFGSRWGEVLQKLLTDATVLSKLASPHEVTGGNLPAPAAIVLGDASYKFTGASGDKSIMTELQKAASLKTFADINKIIELYSNTAAVEGLDQLYSTGKTATIAEFNARSSMQALASNLRLGEPGSTTVAKSILDLKNIAPAQAKLENDLKMNFGYSLDTKVAYYNDKNESTVKPLKDIFGAYLSDATQFKTHSMSDIANFRLGASTDNKNNKTIEEKIRLRIPLSEEELRLLNSIGYVKNTNSFNNYNGANNSNLIPQYLPTSPMRTGIGAQPSMFYNGGFGNGFGNGLGYNNGLGGYVRS